MRNEKLSEFGKFMVRSVRDAAIEDWRRSLNGELKDSGTVRVGQLLEGLNPENRAVLSDKILPAIVDSVMHHLMWSLERDEGLRMSWPGVGSVADASDGLSGDYLGWRDAFAQEKVFKLFT